MVSTRARERLRGAPTVALRETLKLKIHQANLREALEKMKGTQKFANQKSRHSGNRRPQGHLKLTHLQEELVLTCQGVPQQLRRQRCRIWRVGRARVTSPDATRVSRCAFDKHVNLTGVAAMATATRNWETMCRTFTMWMCRRLGAGCASMVSSFFEALRAVKGTTDCCVLCSSYSPCPKRTLATRASVCKGAFPADPRHVPGSNYLDFQAHYTDTLATKRQGEFAICAWSEQSFQRCASIFVPICVAKTEMLSARPKPKQKSPCSWGAKAFLLVTSQRHLTPPRYPFLTPPPHLLLNSLPPSFPFSLLPSPSLLLRPSSLLPSLSLSSPATTTQWVPPTRLYLVVVVVGKKEEEEVSFHV